MKAALIARYDSDDLVKVAETAVPVLVEIGKRSGKVSSKWREQSPEVTRLGLVRRMEVLRNG